MLSVISQICMASHLKLKLNHSLQMLDFEFQISLFITIIKITTIKDWNK